MKKPHSICAIFLIIFSSLYLTSCGLSLNKDKLTKEKATEISNKMIQLSDKYPHIKNQLDTGAGATNLELYDDNLKAASITFGNDPLISKFISLTVKMKITDTNFNLDDYPKYKDALDIYYQSNSNKISQLSDGISSAISSATTNSPGKIDLFKSDTESVVGAVKLLSDNSYELILVCTIYYEN